MQDDGTGVRESGAPFADSPFAKEVTQQLARLGAQQRGEPISHRALPIDECWEQSFEGGEHDTWRIGAPGRADPGGELREMPATIVLMYHRIDWPNPLTFESASGDCEELDIVCASAGLDTVVDGKRRLLVQFANTTESYGLFFLDALDPSPDPRVYTSDTDGMDVELCNYRLSDFLAALSAG